MPVSGNTKYIPSTTLVTLVGTFIVFTTWLDHLNESLLSWCKTYAVIGENIPTGWYLLARWCNIPLFVCSLLAGDSGSTRWNCSPFFAPDCSENLAYGLLNLHFPCTKNLIAYTEPGTTLSFSLWDGSYFSLGSSSFPSTLFFNKLPVRTCSDVRRGRCLEIKFFEFALLIISVNEDGFSKKWTLANIGYRSLLCTRCHL